MTTPVPFPADRPAHGLDYWLSPELAGVSPATAPSRLRQLADAQGTLAAAWSSAIGSGPVCALAGGIASLMLKDPVWVLVLGPVGAALVVLGLVFWKRVRATLPDAGRLLISRGPGSARGGIMMVSVLSAILGGALAVGLPATAARGTATLTGMISAYLLLVALLVACIVVPSVVMGRARQSFRRRLQANADLRKAVEVDLASWRDPYGNVSYGPL